MSRLAIGTAQFGMPYGIANRLGQVQGREVANVLEVARRAQVDTLDTAINYGESEHRLGQTGVCEFKVISKLPEIPENSNVMEWIFTQVRQSLLRLKVDRLYGLLLHRPNQLLQNRSDAIAKALEQLKVEGLVEKVGVSIYSPDFLNQLQYPIDIVQAPYNLIDRRLFTSGWGDKLSRQGVEIHTRSSFLQGLLLMSRDEIPQKFERWGELWDTWQKWLDSNGVSAVEACIQFCLARSEISRVVVGAESAVQWGEIITAEKAISNGSFPTFNCDDELLINPANWTSL